VLVGALGTSGARWKGACGAGVTGAGSEMMGSCGGTGSVGRTHVGAVGGGASEVACVGSAMVGTAVSARGGGARVGAALCDDTIVGTAWLVGVSAAVEGGGVPGLLVGAVVLVVLNSVGATGMLWWCRQAIVSPNDATSVPTNRAIICVARTPRPPASLRSVDAGPASWVPADVVVVRAFDEGR
jgi:hypothetical protein